MIQEPSDATTTPASPAPPAPFGSSTPPGYGPPPVPGGGAPAPGQPWPGPAAPVGGWEPAGYRPPPGYGPAHGFDAPSGYRPPPGYGPAGYPPPLSPAGQPLATFLDRFLAYLIDGVVLTAVTMALTVPAMIIFFLSDLTASPDGATEPDVTFLLQLLLLEFALVGVMLILAYLYYVEMMFRTGQTLGKKVLKLRVVPLDPAATLNRRFAAKRFLVQFVVALVPGFSYLDGLWQLWDKPYQQCLHDKFARTVVVKVPA